MSFSAKVTFLSKEKGGRITPPMAGYKPHLRVGDEYTSCIVKPKDKDIEVMMFGTEYHVELELMFNDVYGDRISKDMNVELYEGSKLVAIGVITHRKRSHRLTGQ